MAVMDAAAAVCLCQLSSARRSPGFLHAAQRQSACLTASLHFEFQNPSASWPCARPAGRSHSHCKAKAGARARARGTRPFVSPAPPRAALHSSLLLFLPKSAAAWVVCWSSGRSSSCSCVCRPPLLGTSPFSPAAAVVLGERRSGARWEGPGSGSSRS